MSRTIAINLLSGLFPWVVLLFHQLHIEIAPLALLWIIVQAACWGCALALLRWNRDLLGLSILALILNAIFWGFALLMIISLMRMDENYFVMQLKIVIEFLLAGVAVLLLRYGNALVNVRENQLVISENPRPQFQLTWLFSVSIFAAVVTALFLYLQKPQEGDARGITWSPEGLALAFLQVGCWCWIAESLLLPRIRWKTCCLLVVAAGGCWYAILAPHWLGIAIFVGLWIPMQIMVILIPLLYRWAGWRIVPRALAEELLVYNVPQAAAELSYDDENKLET
jgi:hypothetical protein